MLAAARAAVDLPLPRRRPPARALPEPRGRAGRSGLAHHARSWPAVQWAARSPPRHASSSCGSGSCSPAAVRAAPTRRARCPCSSRRSRPAASGSRSCAGRASAGSTPRSSRRSRRCRRPSRRRVFLDHWRSVRKGNVISPVIGVGTAIGLLRLAGEVLELPGLRAASLLDPSPLARSLDGWIDWDALHAQRRLAAWCTPSASSPPRSSAACRSGSWRAPAKPPRSDREIEYVHTRLEGQHVRASAAIPLLFPPVEVTAPLGAAGHYVDGATRLNAPIAPALALGAERVIVVGYEPFAGERPAAGAAGRDSRTSPPTRSTACCSTRSPTTCAGCSPSTRSSPSTRRPARRAPRSPTARRRAARRTGGSPTRWWRRRGAARSARSPRRSSRSATAGCAGCARPTSRCSRGCSAAASARARGELLSFVLFDEVFIERLLRGRPRRRRALAGRPPGFWSADAAAAGFDAPEVSAETVALDEFRARRRH